MRPNIPLLFVLGLLGVLSATLVAQEAPVPASIMIPRPSAEEIAQAERSLQEYKNSLDPAMAAIVGKYPELIEVRPPRINSAIVPSLWRGFFQKHNNNVQRAKQGDISVLFMGDSITDFWRNEEGNYAGKPVFDEYFADMNVANFGIAGDTTQGVLYRLQNGEGENFDPKAVMLMIGTNNTRQNTSAEIAEGIGAVVLQLQNNFPSARILLLAVFPRGDANDSLRAINDGVNAIIKTLHDGDRVFFLDIGHIFLDESGNIPADIMVDGLHPSTKGYRLWAEAIIEPLSDLL